MPEQLGHWEGGGEVQHQPAHAGSDQRPDLQKSGADGADLGLFQWRIFEPHPPQMLDQHISKRAQEQSELIGNKVMAAGAVGKESELLFFDPVQGELRVRLSLGSILPPADVSSSILAIVMNSCRQVLFLHPSTPSGSIAHVLIGGRSEPGETPEQTAIREVGEETGWQVEPIRMIGFRHFFHLEPRSEKTDRPYPHFIQPIFASRALAYNANLAVPGDLIPAEFIDFVTADGLTEFPQRPLLRAAAAVI